MSKKSKSVTKSTGSSKFELEVIPPGNTKSDPILSRDMIDFLTPIFRHEGFTGTWQLRTNTRTRATNRLTLIEQIPRQRVVRLRLMPSDSGSCWVCSLRVPEKYSVSKVYERLSMWSGYDGKNLPQSIQQEHRGRDAALPDEEAQSTSPVDVGELAKQEAREAPGSRLVEQIAGLEAKAKAYRERQSRIEELQEQSELAQKEADALIEKAAKYDAQRQELEQEQAQDVDGHDASTVLETLQRLMS